MKMNQLRTAWLVMACAILLAIPAWSTVQNDQYGNPPATQSQTGNDTQAGTSTTTQSESTTTTTKKHKKRHHKKGAKGTQTTPSTTTPSQTNPNQSSLNQGTGTNTSGMIIPAGTRVVARMVDSINSDVNRPGDRFRCTLDEDLVVNGSVLAPKGSDCFGRVVQFSQTSGQLQNQPAMNTYGNTATGVGSGFGSSTQPGNNPAAESNLGSTAGTSNAGIASSGTSNTGSSVSGTANAGMTSQNQNLGTTPSTMNQSAPNSSAQNQPAPNQSGMSQSGISGQVGTQTQPGVSGQYGAETQPGVTGQSGMQAGNVGTGNLGLILTEVDVNGQRFLLGGANQTTLSSTQMGNTGAEETAGISVVDFNQGAPATSVVSSAPSTTGSNMGAGIGSGAGAANQVVINGSHLNIPSQTVLEFRLQEPQSLLPATGSNVQTP